MAPRIDQPRTLERPGSGLTERSRDRILAAALDEFANRGFDGTTTAEIARRAGVTQPLVHYHFESKDALWKSAVGDAFNGAAASFDGVYPELADLDAVDQMKVLVRRFVRLSATHPELARIVCHEGVLGGPRLRWLIDHHMTDQFDWFRGLLGQGIAEGRIKALPIDHVLNSLTAAAAYLFIVKAAMADMHGIDVTDPVVIEAHADTVVELFFHGLVVDPYDRIDRIEGVGA